MGSDLKTQQYSEDSLPEYTPMPWSLKEIRAAIPAEYFVRDTARGLSYFGRDVLLAATAWTCATYIDPYFQQAATKELLTPIGAEVARWAAWLVYWWFQGLIFTGIWVIGHECGHGAFSDHKIVNDVLGFITHTFLWTPYFSWRISHHRHHSNHASMERDEVYVPKTREDLGIPDKANEEIDWDEIFGDTPIYTLYMLIRQQVLAFPAYLLFNVSGQKNYPKWTNHFDPNSILFTKAQRNVVIISNIGIAAMVYGVVHFSSIYGAGEVIKYYGIPWLLVSHWFIMITYLHHTDPLLPHYRGKEWNFQRGAAATVDRDFLGWQGRFFLHDVAHFHVIHHFFPKMPFYHGPEATQHLKAFIGEHYAYSNKNPFKALWESYNKCQFVENEGDVLFYRDKKGQAVRRPAAEYRVKSKTQ
ncbi:Delta(12) fatty acid desaturase [Psilocybe cubensis]|uniref:Fatty acid desaturase domain-containing protein n=2 Tax=Psilocybe cubensis TaxID=181762 RepID=A0A8H7XLQ8_PSICU|nr:Delta(12) fatty acid desaturase [Psilocybe cubensis]KAH9475531.1 Delta(12) fatty acid desaturase [Psilocybe cubensis]